ncbi:MAG: hypothetical protein CVU30_14175 [Betaproteobacteria bacterium HGW-Betaproteobacteria-3]|nr:MAG: hypothetical protein CVU30_14175 [Betaproteobacteria bacterium HGW-Betaproteobacteria-3]
MQLVSVRPRGRAGTGRAFYCFMASRRVTILHAFIKKTHRCAGAGGAHGLPLHPVQSGRPPR